MTWTQEKGFIEVSEDYIAHDLVVNLYSASLDDETYEKFEAFSDDVQKQYYNYPDDKFEAYKEVEQRHFYAWITPVLPCSVCI